MIRKDKNLYIGSWKIPLRVDALGREIVTVPDTDRRGLCLTESKKGVKGYYLGYYADGRWCCGMNSNVVAWMELPEPPEEEADNMIVAEIDGAVTLYGAEKKTRDDGEVMYKIPPMDSSYKYAMMIDGVPMCSKDAERWVVCIAIQGDDEVIKGKRLYELLAGTGNDGL